MRKSEREMIAEYLADETKHGRASSILKVKDHFRMEKSNASRAMNELKKHGIVMNGHRYEMQKRGVMKLTPDGKDGQAFILVIVKDDPKPVKQGVQSEPVFWT